MKKVISVAVALLFFVNSISYALSPMPGSAVPTTQKDMYAAGRRLFDDKRGPSAIDFENIPEFTGEIPKIPGLEFVDADYNDTPFFRGKNPILAKTDLVEALEYFKTHEAMIPDEYLSIEVSNWDYDEEGEIRIAKLRDNNDGSYTLILHEDFVKAWNDIRENDVWFKTNIGGQIRVISVAWGIFYRIAKHEMSDIETKNRTYLPKSKGHLTRSPGSGTLFLEPSEIITNEILGRYRAVNNAIWLWFLGSYACTKNTKFNNDTLKARLKWFFEGEDARKMGLHLEFPYLDSGVDDKDTAITLALLINYHFYSEEKSDMRASGEKLLDFDAAVKASVQSHMSVYKDWMEVGAVLKVWWSTPLNGLRTHTGAIRLVAYDEREEPFLWLEGLPERVYLRDIKTVDIENVSPAKKLSLKATAQKRFDGDTGPETSVKQVPKASLAMARYKDWAEKGTILEIQWMHPLDGGKVYKGKVKVGERDENGDEYIWLEEVPQRVYLSNIVTVRTVDGPSGEEASLKATSARKFDIDFGSKPKEVENALAGLKMFTEAIENFKNQLGKQGLLRIDAIETIVDALEDARDWWGREPVRRHPQFLVYTYWGMSQQIGKLQSNLEHMDFIIAQKLEKILLADRLYRKLWISEEHLRTPSIEKYVSKKREVKATGGRRFDSPGEIDFIMKQLKEFSGAIETFIKGIKEQGLSRVKEVTTIVSELERVKNWLSEDPAGRYDDFNFHVTGGEMTENIGIQLRSLEQNSLATAQQVVDILWKDVLYGKLRIGEFKIGEFSSLIKEHLEAWRRQVQQYTERGVTHRVTLSAQEIERLLLEREAEIDSFVLGKMSEDERNKFVQELRNNRNLRFAVWQYRSNLPEEKVVISAEALSLIRKAYEAFWGGNQYFPGSSRISGIETRPYIAPDRRKSYGKAVDYYNHLIELGELEDVAIDNIYRIGRNNINADEIISEYQPSSYHDRIGREMAGGLLAAFTEPRVNETVNGRFEPLEISKHFEGKDIKATGGRKFDADAGPGMEEKAKAKKDFMRFTEAIETFKGDLEKEGILGVDTVEDMIRELERGKTWWGKDVIGRYVQFTGETYLEMVQMIGRMQSYLINDYRRIAEKVERVLRKDELYEQLLIPETSFEAEFSLATKATGGRKFDANEGPGSKREVLHEDDAKKALRLFTIAIDTFERALKPYELENVKETEIILRSLKGVKRWWEEDPVRRYSEIPERVNEMSQVFEARIRDLVEWNEFQKAEKLIEMLLSNKFYTRLLIPEHYLEEWSSYMDSRKKEHTPKATGGRKFDADAGPGAETEIESDNLIDIIREYVVLIARDEGPGSEITLTVEETSWIYETIGLLQESRIDILIPQQVGLTGSVKKALKEMEKRGGESVVSCREYSSKEHLKKLLQQKVPEGVKRIIITEEDISQQVGALAEEDTELFRGKRLLNIKLPEEYRDMTEKEKTVQQARIIMLGILARLVEKDKTPMVESVLKEMLKDHIIDVNGFIKVLQESGSETADAEDIKRHIQYFLSKMVSLIETLDKEIKMMKAFWTSA